MLGTLPAVPSLRKRAIFAAVRDALSGGSLRFGLRIVHFSVQGNHIHLIVEACDSLSLTRGMQGLMVRIARAVNRAAGRKGKVFADHYFARELRSPAQVRRAVRYVLDNAMLHAGVGPRTDDRASDANAPVVTLRTWLLSVGWLRSPAGALPVSAWSTFDEQLAAAATAPQPPS